MRPPPRPVPYLLVALVAAAVHLRTVAFPFVFDDQWLVAGNMFLREGWSVFTAFAHHFWHGTPFATGYYRPVVVASLAINGVALGWGPAGFHLVNVLLHAVNATLMVYLLRRLGLGASAATLAALFFAVHPAATWPVASVVARVDLLPLLFLLLAAIALAAFLPASNLLLPVGSLYAQNFLYLPLAGLTAAVGVLLDGILRRDEALFTAWSERFPRYGLGWSRLGVARLGRGDARGAEAALRTALGIEDRNGEGHYNLGLALLSKVAPGDTTRIEEGLAHSRRASALVPNLAAAHVSAARALVLLDRPAEAESEARAALAIDAGATPARVNLAEALFRQARYREALELLRGLAKEFPGDPNVRSPLVVSLVNAGELDEARVEGEAARRDFPDLAWFRKVPDFAGYPEP